jgi:hypothetical protein
MCQYLGIVNFSGVTFMRCLFLMCAESSAIDAPTGRLSAFHIIEELTASSFPVVVPHLHLVAMLERGRQESVADASAVLSLNGVLVGNPLKLAIDFRDRDQTKLVANIQGVVLQKAGKLTVSLEHGGASLGKWEIRVVQAKTQQQAPEAPTESAVLEPETKPNKRRKEA